MHIFLPALVLGSLAGAATQSDQCESAPTFPKPPPAARELAPDPPYETAFWQIEDGCCRWHTDYYAPMCESLGLCR